MEDVMDRGDIDFMAMYRAQLADRLNMRPSRSRSLSRRKLRPVHAAQTVLRQLRQWAAHKLGVLLLRFSIRLLAKAEVR